MAALGGLKMMGGIFTLNLVEGVVKNPLCTRNNSYLLTARLRASTYLLQ